MLIELVPQQQQKKGFVFQQRSVVRITGHLGQRARRAPSLFPSAELMYRKLSEQADPV